MQINIKEITSIEIEAGAIRNQDQLNKFKSKYLGKNSTINKELKSLSIINNKEERKKRGKELNILKTKISDLISLTSNRIANEKVTNQKALSLDVTLPTNRNKVGAIHPISRSIDRIEKFFVSNGFTPCRGPEIEDSYHNFDALNIPIDHPTRSDTDTFYFDPNLMLRAHTSNVQIRAMLKMDPPLKIISAGRVYRNDYDRTHTPMFHQVEGLWIADNLNFSNLKYVVDAFIAYFFETDSEVRFRPSYFPFTEPSAEVDVKGKSGEWLEVLGCGMVHPNVLQAVNIDPEKYSGFAFGMGVERLTMLRYNVGDLRLFFENDLRFLKQFK
ncbi:phenylalanine--tRNA ligase subunit alpha [Vibrio mimicus]